MANQILSKVDDQVKKYQAEHKGQLPLYVILSPDEGDKALEEINQLKGNEGNVIITTYKGMKIMKHDFLKPGEIRVSNETPETSS